MTHRTEGGWPDGPLSRAAQDYVALRRASGFSLRHQWRSLRSFTRFAQQRGENHVRVDTAIAWARHGRSPDRREALLSVVRIFARHLAAGEDGHEIPPRNVFARGGGPHRRPQPYIFSDEEVTRLIRAARALPPLRGIRPHVYATLLSLLSCTGLRLQEALDLRYEDILSEDGYTVLLIRRTKFRKSRLVPLHPTAKVGLVSYIERRSGLPGSHLFCVETGGPLSALLAEYTFRRLRTAAQIDTRAGAPRARLHCFRHTFAVRALKALGSAPAHVDRLRVALSTYLGHADMRGSYWYFTATPELLREISRTTESGFPVLERSRSRVTPSAVLRRDAAVAKIAKARSNR